jgi:plasmid stabilization system protein ParE
MKLRLTPRALAEAKRKKSWWPAAPELFVDELHATLDAIVANPTLGTAYPSRFDVNVRRVLMPNSEPLRPATKQDIRTARKIV